MNLAIEHNFPKRRWLFHTTPAHLTDAVGIGRAAAQLSAVRTGAGINGCHVGFARRAPGLALIFKRSFFRFDVSICS
jgi:hypothetical protein